MEPARRPDRAADPDAAAARRPWRRRGARLRVVLWAAALALVAAAPAGAEVGTGGVSDGTDPGVTADPERLEVLYDADRGPGPRADQRRRANFATRFRVRLGTTSRDGQCVADGPGDLLLDQTLIWDITYGSASVDGGVVAGADVTQTYPSYVYT
ncbi:MAG: hypothetical protein M3P39_07725 [Actinomycetota bacterium]|nr:hypothetical protein [Actinomycetota bacterium]